jgi:phage shock protein PspC (stress-responsive transcriptional regulator)
MEVVVRAQQHELRRSHSNRMIGGVCGGLAEFFGINSFWFRLAFLISLIPGGVPGLLLYVILWIVIPG